MQNLVTLGVDGNSVGCYHDLYAGYRLQLSWSRLVRNVCKLWRCNY